MEWKELEKTKEDIPFSAAGWCESHRFVGLADFFLICSEACAAFCLTLDKGETAFSGD